MEKNIKRISGKKNLPFDLIIKKYRLLFGYYSRDFWKNVFYGWSMILFGISFILFLSVLAPNLVLHKTPIGGDWQRMLELDGSVVVEINDNNYSRFPGVAGVAIEIGGYNSITDQDGKFYIKFASETSSNIPVIIQWYNTTIIKKVSFEPNQYKKKEVFILNGK